MPLNPFVIASAVGLVVGFVVDQLNRKKEAQDAEESVDRGSRDRAGQQRRLSSRPDGREGSVDDSSSGHLAGPDDDGTDLGGDDRNRQPDGNQQPDSGRVDEANDEPPKTEGGDTEE